MLYSTCACLGVYKLELETDVRKNHNQRRKNGKGSQKIKIQLKSEKCASLGRITKARVRVWSWGGSELFLTAHRKKNAIHCRKLSHAWPQVKARTVQILLMTWETEVMAQQISDTEATGVQKSIGLNTHWQEPLTLKERENRRRWKIDENLAVRCKPYFLKSEVLDLPTTMNRFLNFLCSSFLSCGIKTQHGNSLFWGPFVSIMLQSAFGEYFVLSLP